MTQMAAPTTAETAQVAQTATSNDAKQGASAPAPMPSASMTPNSSETSATTSQPLGFEVPQPKDTLTATGLLLAFLIGFYTLIGRERKSPYLTNGLFQILLLSVPAVILSLLAQVLSSPIGWSVLIAKVLALLAFLFLVAALVLTLFRVYKFYMRFALFVDSANPKHMGWIRTAKHMFRRGSENKRWEWNAIPLSDSLQKRVEDILRNPEEAPSGESNVLPTSAAISVSRHGRANRVLAQLATAFLEEQRPVQYMTASRHPLEFVTYLKQHVEEHTKLKWPEIQSKIVVADAYTRHFGYADSIYMNATTALKRDFGVQHVTAGESFAGLHTASSVAFNKIKEHAPKDRGRGPMLIIYEDCYALADLESREQYRVFVRHVLPSERMWQAMFTVFIETAQEESDWKLLASYCDLTLVDKAKPSE